MTATSRPARSFSMPPSRAIGAQPRLRRVTGISARPFGTISLFLAATGILGLTSLCYLWQESRATEAAMAIPALNAELGNVQNQTQMLQAQVYRLTSSPAVIQSAAKYGMVWPSDANATRTVAVPGPAVTHVVAIHAPARPRSLTMRVPATSASAGAWWQVLWGALYHVTH